MDCESYLKGGVFDRMQQTYPHNILKIIYFDKGTILNSKNKFHPCFILQNLAGIYFYCKKLMHTQLILKTFISIYDIREIKYLDPKKRQILTQYSDVTFTSDHIDQTIIKLRSTRSFLFYKIPDLHSMKLTAFPQMPTLVKQEPAQNSMSISAIRYICQALRRNDPIDTKLLSLAQTLFEQNNQTLIVTQDFPLYKNIHSITDTISLSQSLTTVIFSNYAPYAICTIIHFILKRSETIRTIVLQNYSIFIPYQMKLQKLSNIKGPISLIFDNCQFNDYTFQLLIEHLGKFNGEYQRLSFNNLQFTSCMIELLFEMVKKTRSFRTLEMFELSNVDPSADFTKERLNKAAGILLHQCPLLSSAIFSFKKSLSYSVPVSLSLFLPHNIISEIVINGQIITEKFSKITINPYLRLLDLSKNTFSMDSLQSIFSLLSSIKRPKGFVFSIQDISINDSDWNSFFEFLTTIQPIQCITELDWSGNPIPSQNIETFVRTFFSNDLIRYISIDRVFSSSSINELGQLMTLIKQYLNGRSLWGLSIKGDDDNNFSGNSFSSFLSNLAIISPFHSLNINNHKLLEPDLLCLVDFLKQHKEICEISIDDTRIQNARSLYSFYSKLFNLPQFNFLARPYKDIKRIFPDFNNFLRKVSLGDQNDKQNTNSNFSETEWDTFRNDILKRHCFASRSERALFYNKDKDNNSEVYAAVINKYPIALFDSNQYDIYSIKHQEPNYGALSAFCCKDENQEQVQSNPTKISASQSKFLHDPMVAPLDYKP